MAIEVIIGALQSGKRFSALTLFWSCSGMREDNSQVQRPDRGELFSSVSGSDIDQ